MNQKIRIVLIGDYEFLRYALQSILEQQEDFEVVGSYASAEEVVSRIGVLSPDIVLIDADMPLMNGIEGTLRLKKNGVDYAGDVIVLADSDKERTAALQAGAAGYLIKKDIEGKEFAQAIRTIYRTNGSLEGNNGFVEEVVQFVIPRGAHASEMFTFMCQLNDLLQDNCSHGCVVSVDGSWDKGTVMNLSLGRMPASDFLCKLSRMPDVEKVEELEASEFTASISGIRYKYELLQRLCSAPTKMMRITLKGPITARREPVAVLK